LYPRYECGYVDLRRIEATLRQPSTIPPLDSPDAVEVSFPDEAGNITVSAPVGSFEPGASVMIVNNTNGIVTSGFVLGDGSFSFELKATIHDEIEIRIIDSSEREVVIQKRSFVPRMEASPSEGKAA
jgi:hypothetical protein